MKEDSEFHRALDRFRASEEETQNIDARVRCMIEDLTQVLRSKDTRRERSELPYIKLELGWMFGEDVYLCTVEKFTYRSGFWRRSEGFIHVLASGEIDMMFKVPEYTTILFRVPNMLGEQVLALRFTGTAIRHIALFDHGGTGRRVLFWTKFQEVAYDLFVATRGDVRDTLNPDQALGYHAMTMTTIGSLRGLVATLQRKELSVTDPVSRQVLRLFWRTLAVVFPPKQG